MFSRLCLTIVSAIFLFSGSLVFPPSAKAVANLPPQHLAETIVQNQTSAETISPKTALERLFTAKEIKSDWFAPIFVNQIPVEQVKLIIADIQKQLGSYQEVKQNGNDYLIILSKGSVPTKIVLNSKKQITGLLFQAPNLKIASLEKALAEFKALPGKVSFLVKEDKLTLADLNGNNPLAVGSAFKLAVLQALQQEISLGKRYWSDVVTFNAESKSLPSGILQNWPDGSPLTIQTLATLMISVSDNTATDILINLLGKESLELISPRNRPFLTTRELFVLKGSENRKLLEDYRKGNLAKRKLLLVELAKFPLPDVREFEGTNPVAIDSLEWFFTAEELCGAIKEVGNLPLMGVNPGLANPNDWEKIAFKGGSEPGVLNLTSWLQGKNGKNYCVVATWNNKNASLDESKFFATYTGVLSLLAERK